MAPGIRQHSGGVARPQVDLEIPHNKERIVSRLGHDHLGWKRVRRPLSRFYVGVAMKIVSRSL
ncbi:MAG: hypothetical protein CM15mP68_6260 [Pseudomonadota bacterium]|nr:MAG: hypothetical protein CM15mP68_6260 [Pseudomonadota bacterium]